MLLIPMWETILTAILVFAATNVDDILILTLFFSQTNETFRKRHIILGQYLGFFALCTISLLGFFSSFFIPQTWIGLLGIAPIVIGIKKLTDHKNSNPIQVPQMQPATKAESFFSSLWNPKTYSVAAVTFANGGDNIGIYMPLFATSDALQVSLTLAIFLILIAIWCFVGYKLARQPAIAHILSKYGHVIVPFVLIGLGIYILLENHTLTLLSQFQIRGNP